MKLSGGCKISIDNRDETRDTLRDYVTLDETSMIRVIENLSEFVYETVPEGTIVKCRITRNRKGVDKGKNWAGKKRSFIINQTAAL